MTRAEFDEVISLALRVARLGPDWAAAATSAELELVENAAHLAVVGRRGDWAAIETGAWPC